MRKGFNLTLMSVAIALMGLQSMTFAMAPVIGNVPDVIVGDMENATQPNTFVFPDAFNLGAYVTDPDTPDQDIIWSYAAAADPSRYLINGVQPLDLVTEDPVNPPLAKRIGSQVLGEETNNDNNPQTITVRDQSLSPLGGSNTDPGADGLSAGEVVTLFASDGTETDTKDLMIYTDNGGRDRLTGAGIFDPGSDQMVEQVFFYGGQTGGFSSTIQQSFGTVTFGTGANGVSIGVGSGATGLNPNIGVWQSADGFIPLVNNSVWRLRMNVTSDVVAAGTTPLWDVVVNNDTPIVVGTTTYRGPYAFGTDYYFLDNEGAANAAGALGRTQFEVWYTPLPMGTAQFAQAFDPAQDPYNDMVVMFRVLDGFQNGTDGIQSALDAGTLTLSELEVDRFDISRVAPIGSPLFNATSITDGRTPTGVPTDFTTKVRVNTASTTINYSGGVLTVSPTGAGWTTPGEAVDIMPSDDEYDYATGTETLDFPVIWETNTLYRVQASLSVPDATPGESNPPDVITVGMDSPTNELINFSYMTAGLTVNPGLPSAYHIGMPKVIPATYQMFFFSQGVTKSTAPNANRLRPRVQVLCDANVLGGVTQSLGGVSLSSVRVDKVNLTE